jgi:hypothetical protein
MAGSTTIIVAFPKEPIEGGDWCIGPLPVSATGQPEIPSCPPYWVGVPDITGMAIDASGSLWYLENAQEGAILWRLPAGS